MKARNVQAVLTENFSQVSNHSRNIHIVEHEHIFRKNGFHAVFVNLYDSGIAIAKYTSSYTSRSILTGDLYLNCAGVLVHFVTDGLLHFNASFFCNKWSVYHIDAIN